MKRSLVAFLVLNLAACDGNFCLVNCDGGQSTAGPSALPSPSPSPSPIPGSTPDPCRVESVRVDFHSGAQVPFLAVGATEQLDATPYNSSGAVPDGCNLTRAVS